MDDSAKEEAKRQSVILLFSLVGTALTVVIVRWLQKPDSYRETRMRFALWGKRFAQSQVDWWQARADRFATAYNKDKA